MIGFGLGVMLRRRDGYAARMEETAAAVNWLNNAQFVTDPQYQIVILLMLGAKRFVHSSYAGDYSCCQTPSFNFDTCTVCTMYVYKVTR